MKEPAPNTEDLQDKKNKQHNRPVPSLPLDNPRLVSTNFFS